MALERGIPNFWTWLLGNPVDQRLFLPETWGFLWGTIAICFLILLAVPFLSFVLTSFRYGPSEAFYYVYRALFTSVTDDLPRFSFRRCLAIARLAVQEAIRNRILIGFGVFVILLLFAGLFLDVNNSNPARVYLSFVLSTTNYLVLLMALVLSSFSLPNDIKNRTIYTVVTKPIRAGEIVLGRTLGFVAVTTVMLVAMGLISYLFVRRGLSHDHVAVASDLQVEHLPGGVTVRRGQTSFDNHHRHTFEIGADGKGRTNVVNGHWHDVELVGEGAQAAVRISPPRGQLIARAPIYGTLTILDRDGKVVPRGVNVGNEWEYRSYIEGGPQGGTAKSAAIWTFSGITPERFPNGLPLEMTIRVFRTYKGDIEQGILGEIVIRNPDPAARVKRSGQILFESKEYMAYQRLIPRELLSQTGTEKLDLYRDLVSPDGRVEVEIRCAESSQYFGVAQADLYLRPADSTFELNFTKAYLSIWLQMLLVTAFGVTFSTFLSGPVAMLATISAVGLGFFGEFIRGVAKGTIEGGGPLESIIRIITQQNVMTDLEMHTIVVQVVKGCDQGLMRLLQAATYILPDYRQFDTTAFVADGYSIFPDLVAQQIVMAAVHGAVVIVVGYFCLKTREVAA